MAKRDDDERPKRSWSEIDKLRDKAHSRGQSRDQRAQERVQRNPAYGQYKAQVSKMFGGGEIPEMLREKLDPTGELKARDDLLKRIKKLAPEDRKAWADAVREYVEKFELPEDVYLLGEWLDHPRDQVVEKTLGELEQLAADGVLGGKKKVPAAIEQRLRALEMSSDDPELKERAKALRERLR
ncbi:MAG TPA: hypothetical protein DFS52_20520 [Myxococcales bacterium]|jgi:hypothetical protein|nr:hypothetical protein [Myxococcales bacterium]